VCAEYSQRGGELQNLDGALAPYSDGSFGASRHPEDIGVGRVRHVLPAWSTQEQGIYAIYPGHRFISAKVSAFVDYFAQWLHVQVRGKA
jgi:DNA-binding transcriptional LysR family regulator